eukprot:g6836.t1
MSATNGTLEKDFVSSGNRTNRKRPSSRANPAKPDIMAVGITAGITVSIMEKVMKTVTKEEVMQDTMEEKVMKKVTKEEVMQDTRKEELRHTELRNMKENMTRSTTMRVRNTHLQQHKPMTVRSPKAGPCGALRLVMVEWKGYRKGHHWDTRLFPSRSVDP